MWLLTSEFVERITTFFSRQAPPEEQQQEAEKKSEKAASSLPSPLAGANSPGLGNTNNSGPFKLSFQEELPLQDYFKLIDKHFKHRLELKEMRELLEKRATQFRCVEKRLLIRFKDKNPQPLNSLDVLLEGTYKQLIQVGNSYEKAEHALKVVANALQCATNFMLLLMRYRFQLDEPNYQVLKAHFCPSVKDTPEQVSKFVNCSYSVLTIVSFRVGRNA